MKEIFRIELALEPTSINNTYVPRYSKGKRWTFSKDETKDYKKRIQEEVAALLYKEGALLPMIEKTQIVRLHLEFGMDVYFKNGKPRKKDVSNYIKATEDAVTSVIGIDDSYNFDLKIMKYDFKDIGRTGPVVFVCVSIGEYSEVVFQSMLFKKENAK